MKALLFHEHGDASVLRYEEVELPERKAGWARLKVKAVALNHLDIWIRRGWKGLSLPLPHITGADICGEVVELDVGEHGLKAGDAVTVYPGVIGPEDEFVKRGEPSVSPSYQVLGEHCWGGLAEYIDVPVQNLIPVIGKVAPSEVAAPNLVVTTVWRMLFKRGQLSKGETVLVVGSGGGVNSLSIQIASAFGAHVIALAGGEEKADKARELGAHEVIDYKQVEKWHRTVLEMTSGVGVDLVVDNTGEATYRKSLSALKRGGRLVTVGNTSGFDIALDNRLIFGKQLSVIGSTMGSIEDWKEGLSFLEQNQITVAIDGIYPLSQGKEQLERMERGEHFGKIVLVP